MASFLHSHDNNYLWHFCRNQRTFRPKKSTPSEGKFSPLPWHCGFLQSSESSLCTLTEFCTPEICPTMTAGPKYVILELIHLIYK
ncbi:putative MOB kinase activator family [Helianthus anomalus]